MGFQYDPKRVWFLCNHVYDNTSGIGCGSGNVGGREEFYFIGNLIHGVTNGIQLNGLNTPEPAVLANNTIYNTENGIHNGYYTSKMNIINNIVANSARYTSFGSDYQTYQISDMSYNLFDGNGEIRWGSTYSSLSDFQQATGKGTGCIETDPLFVDPANQDFHLQDTSPAIDAGTSSGVVQEVFDRFEQLYGIDIRVDIAGGARPYGTGWDIGAYEWGSTPYQPEPEPEHQTDQEDISMPTETKLNCYNNVINPKKGEEATIHVELDKQAHVQVIIYDNKGKKIKTIIDENKEPGFYPMTWTGKDSTGSTVGSGIYLVHMKSGGYSKTAKIAIVK